MNIQISKSEWQRIGAQMGWIKRAQSTYGDSYWAERDGPMDDDGDDGNPYHPEYGDSAGKKIILTSGPNNLGKTVSAEEILARDVRELLSKGQKWVLEKNAVRGMHILYTGSEKSVRMELVRENELEAAIKYYEGK
jgi:hypothetical protein